MRVSDVYLLEELIRLKGRVDGLLTSYTCIGQTLSAVLCKLPSPFNRLPGVVTAPTTPSASRGGKRPGAGGRPGVTYRPKRLEQLAMLYCRVRDVKQQSYRCAMKSSWPYADSSGICLFSVRLIPLRPLRPTGPHSPRRPSAPPQPWPTQPESCHTNHIQA
jgi:hypothetical protein